VTIRPAIETRFVIGYCCSNISIRRERWLYNPYFQHFTVRHFSFTNFPTSALTSAIGKRLGSKLELLLTESLRAAHATGRCALATSNGHGGHRGLRLLRPRLGRNGWISSDRDNPATVKKSLFTS
jgi:hypothetical protein